MTLAGTVVQGLAEFLGVATALQVAAPGARLVFCFGSGVLDMRFATFSLGCVESALMGAMATEVGHYLGVPTLNPGLSTDSKHAGLQTGYEKAPQGRRRLWRQPRHRHGLGSHRFPQHHVPAAIGDRQRDRRHGPAPLRRRRGLRRHAGGGVHRPGRSGRRVPRRKGHRPPHPRGRAPAAVRVRQALLRQVARRGPHRERRGRRRGRAPPCGPCRESALPRRRSPRRLWPPSAAWTAATCGARVATSGPRPSPDTTEAS